MATSRTFASLRPVRHRSLIAALACLLGALIVPPAAVGESISSSNFKIDIASNMAWVDNHGPALGRKLWRQTAMEQAVLSSRPYVRVTNNSTGGQLTNFQLNLQNRDSVGVTDVLLPPEQRGSQWKWSDDLHTLFVDFVKPVASGDEFTIRVVTGPNPAAPARYSLMQNFFAPGQPIFGQASAPAGSRESLSGMDGWGLLGLTVYDPSRALGGAGAGGGNSADQFLYSLQAVAIDPYKTAGQQVGITIAPVAVPEPSTAVLLTAAAVAGTISLVRRRRPAA